MHTPHRRIPNVWSLHSSPTHSRSLTLSLSLSLTSQTADTTSTSRGKMLQIASAGCKEEQKPSLALSQSSFLLELQQVKTPKHGNCSPRLYPPVRSSDVWVRKRCLLTRITMHGQGMLGVSASFREPSSKGMYVLHSACDGLAKQAGRPALFLQ
ncbi:hypothetical protein HD806DRAFT_503752 [Xylariaceae sp. AK1471]|nr:hypothetical protein HD806DRAFT_503752 [Xylariaceae sp. AK1471]